MRCILFIFLLSLLIKACGQGPSSIQKDSAHFVSPKKQHTVQVNTIVERFAPPAHYKRILVDSTSFPYFLRHLPLKPEGAKVAYFDGKTKPNSDIYDGVIDLPIGKRNLHQCADAVIRLRAEYLYKQKKFDSIHFNFTNGFLADYNNWRQGKRIVVEGNDVRWKQHSKPSDSHEDFWKYLEMVFSYAGTASLEKEMNSIPFKDMKIGDVFIQGGYPGHAVIVVDMAIKPNSKKVFLLAQSYMPAQELQILKNRNNSAISPWYALDFDNGLVTPEWKFKKSHLKRFVK